ncbi:hypothetical protein vseg_013217 [Gypsophila vaccaria]
MPPKKRGTQIRALRSVADAAVRDNSPPVSPRLPTPATLGDFIGNGSSLAARTLVSVPPATAAAQVIAPVTDAALVVTDAAPVLPSSVTAAAPVIPPASAKVPVPPRKQFADTLRTSSKGMALDYVPLIDDKIVIDLEDVQEEIDFWSTTLVGTVLGRRVSLAQLNSLVHKHWNHVSPPDVL